jgi:hypothetical protein
MKTRPSLLTEDHGGILQDILSPDVSQRVTIADGGSSRNSDDFTAMVIEITPTIDCTYALGGSTVVAKSGEDHFIPAYLSKTMNIRENTRIAAQAYTSGETGVLFVSELS